MTFLHNIIAASLIWRMRHSKKYLFKSWLLLEDKKEKIIESVKNLQDDFPNQLFDFIYIATGVSHKWYRQAEWIRAVLLFYACLSCFPQIELPMLSSVDEKKKDDDWSYEGRLWHQYSHILASEYGWSLEYISQLQVEEALAKIQEIMADKQLEREFYYGLSEVAYPYNPQTKKSVYKPLERPHWMLQRKVDIPRFKIPKSMLPEGVVLMDNVLPNEYLPKEIIH